MKLRIAALLMTVGFLGCMSPVFAETCRLSRVAQVPISIDVTGRINVPMTVRGKSLNMLIDTGGFLTELTASTVATLGLQPQLLNKRIIAKGVGGYRIDHFVNVTDIEFGGLKAQKMPFLVHPDDAQVTRDIDGILGPDIMRAYDDDFDFANSTFSLFQADDCEGNHVWWTKEAHAEISFSMDTSGHIRIPVQLDGKTIMALLDSGAATSALEMESAEDAFGFDDNDQMLVRHASGAKSGSEYTYPFKSLSFGDAAQNVTVLNPVLNLIRRSDLALPGPRMLIGINVLRRLHIYISYKNRMIYVTPASAH